jgi:hypothetical protein
MSLTRRLFVFTILALLPLFAVLLFLEQEDGIETMRMGGVGSIALGGIGADKEKSVAVKQDMLHHD